MVITQSMQEAIQSAKQRYKIIGNSQELNEAIFKALQVAPFNVSVLVGGENGTGKEVIPRIIHDSGSRSRKPYFALNCGSIAQGLIESELFGHVKGAFTDAISDHKGYFENADGGTIFLDELGEMPLETQAKLLRVLETGEFIKVGGDKVQRTNVRIVAATNKDLLAAIEKGTFREDLYYRISACEIKIPSLRSRSRDDFELLARFFAREFAMANSARPVTFSSKAIDLLASLEWKGNVRQYKNVIDNISIMTHNIKRELTEADIKPYLPIDRGPFLPTSPDEGVKYSSERAVLWQVINSLVEDVKQLKLMVGDQYGGVAYVNSQAQDLRRNVTVEYNDCKRDAVLEPVAEREAVLEHVTERVKSKPSYKDVAMDVATDVATVKTLDETECEAIHDALRRNDGNRKRTAEELRISERTLYRKIKQYNLVKND